MMCFIFVIQNGLAVFIRLIQSLSVAVNTTEFNTFKLFLFEDNFVVLYIFY